MVRVKKRTILSSITIVILVMWTFSCGQPGTIMEEEQSRIEIDTVREGSFISPSDTIPLAVLYDAEYVFPDKLEIFLRSAEGELLASETVDAVGLAEQTLPPLSLPELETGLYVLDLLLYAGEEVIREKQIEFFYVSGSYSIRGISSYPPVITPGSAAVFQARLEVPAGSDPYLVWKIGEKTIAAGYVSEGGDSIQWKAPDAEGVYSIRMDVFPVGPLTGREFRFASERSMSTEVFVTSVSSEGKYELGPSGSYYTLFHFRGNTADDSDNGALRRVDTVGTPELALRGSLFGYYLGGTSGFMVSENLLPESAGKPAPFSVESRMLIDSPEQGGDIFTVSSASTGSLFRMFINDSRLNLEVKRGVRQVVIESGEEILSADRIYLITLSMHPVGNEYQVSWFVNGVRTASETAFLPELLFPEDTVSTIGGTTGFRGVVDEFGVYYKDPEGRMSVNPDVFREAMEYRLGGDLLFAEGFDGLFLPETIEYTGSIQADEGFLLVGPGSSLSIPDFEIANEFVIFHLELSKSNPETRVVIAAVTPFGEANPVLEYVPDSGSVLLPDGREIIPVNPEEFPGFTLEHNSPELLLVNGDEKISLATGFPDSVTLTLYLQNRSEEFSCELDAILIQREQNRIVKEQKSDPSPEEKDQENV